MVKKVKVKLLVDSPPLKAGDIYECGTMLASMLVGSDQAEYATGDAKESKKKTK